MRCAHGAAFSPIDKLPARNAAGFFYGISGVLRVNLIIGRLLSCSGDPCAGAVTATALDLIEAGFRTRESLSMALANAPHPGA